MKILVLFTNEYEYLLRDFIHRFNYYYGKLPATIVTDKEPQTYLPDNFDYLLIHNWNWREWFVNGLISALKSMDDRFYMIYLVDHYILDFVNHDGINELLDYMRRHDNILRGDLSFGNLFESYGEQLDGDIYQIDKNNEHAGIYGGCAMSPAIWNKQNLIDVLEPHWDVWTCETDGTKKSNYISVGMNKILVKTGNESKRSNL